MEKLRELRKNKNMTMKELGKIFNLAESTISLYEKGKREPDYETMKKFADFFNVSIDYLMGKENNLTSSTISKTNTIVFFGRGEGRKEVELTDNEMKALKQLVKTMKNIPDEDNF